MPAKIDAILIETQNMAQLAEFYRATLGLEAPDSVSEDQIGFQVGDVYLGINAVEEPNTASETLSIWFKVDDVVSTHQKMIEAGATEKDAPEEVDGETTSSVFDPDGNTVGLLSEIAED